MVLRRSQKGGPPLRTGCGRLRPVASSRAGAVVQLSPLRNAPAQGNALYGAPQKWPDFSCMRRLASSCVISLLERLGSQTAPSWQLSIAVPRLPRFFCVTAITLPSPLPASDWARNSRQMPSGSQTGTGSAADAARVGDARAVDNTRTLPIARDKPLSVIICRRSPFCSTISVTALRKKSHIIS